jgi:hypothetical protein
MGGVMKDSQRYREIAGECLSAAQSSRDLDYIRFHLSMAAAWITLARQDEATAALLTSWDASEHVEMLTA